MDGRTIDELVHLVAPGMSVHNLAELMSNPMWQLKRLPIEVDIAIAINSMKSLLKRSRKEIQHALIDECIAPRDPSDLAKQEWILEQMREFIPKEANVQIIANVINFYNAEAGESETNKEVRDTSYHKRL
jgi:hypothetical protein